MAKCIALTGTMTVIVIAVMLIVQIGVSVSFIVVFTLIKVQYLRGVFYDKYYDKAHQVCKRLRKGCAYWRDLLYALPQYRLSAACAK